MDDYYSIIGVDAGATTDDIRTAYREKKDALSTTTGGSSKSDAAKLNKAWNVLSDPYQRGRYDEKRAQALEDGDIEVVEDDEPVVVKSNGAKTRAAAGNRQNPRQRQPLIPTITPPEGTHFPKPKQRIIAMVIDLVVIFALFAGSQAITVALQKSEHRAAYDRKTALVNHEVPDAQKANDNAKKALSDAQKNHGDTAAAQKQVDSTKATLDAKNKELDSVNSTLAPISTVVTLIFMLIVLLYLVVPSAISGRTLGKKIQHLRAVRADGSPLGWGGALKRYGLIVLAAYVLSTLVPLIGPVIVLFGITMWMRNNNQQGIHDRFAKTIVVSDAVE